MEGQPVIIKKVKKGHGGGHGGAWKVAYADFVTAMMAFFLLMWLLAMVSPEKRAGVSYYFKHFNIFDKSGLSFVDPKVTPRISLMDDQAIGKPELSLQIEEEEELALKSGEALSEHLKKEIEAKLSDVKDQIIIDTFEGAVRVEILDKETGTMFPLGSAEISANGKRILKIISPAIIASDRKIAIEGHTDALVFAASHKYSNWELSTERASAARREMERNGLPPDMLIRVTGYAATEPLIKTNLYDPRNRRISILMFYQYKIKDQESVKSNK
ncbi:MAG: OmpA family protein [Deltaproteobacteria bacterium]|nr:OmpA family protein [Deltaproteobacteria bacterium]